MIINYTAVMYDYYYITVCITSNHGRNQSCPCQSSRTYVITTSPPSIGTTGSDEPTTKDSNESYYSGVYTTTIEIATTEQVADRQADREAHTMRRRDPSESTSVFFSCLFWLVPCMCVVCCCCCCCCSVVVPCVLHSARRWCSCWWCCWW